LALGWTYSRNKGRKGKEGTPLPHTVIILSVNYSHHAVVKILINFPTHPTHTIIIVIIKAAVTDLTATQPLCVHNLISVQPPLLTVARPLRYPCYKSHITFSVVQVFRLCLASFCIRHVIFY